MYSDILPPNRQESERDYPHPVYEAFMRLRVSEAFAREDVRQTVIPVYMGLVKQIDDQIGRLMAFLENAGFMDDTMIVFTSDHGDYLGDHWLGEKDLAHEESMRIPLIIVDPDAETTRGSVENRLVESIDWLPTFLDYAGGQPQPHRLEGRSLMPLLRGETLTNWRDDIFCEIDYSGREVRNMLGLPPKACRAYVVRGEQWKFINYEGFPPQLFDLKNDPHEWVDLGTDPAYQPIRDALQARIFAWLRGLKHRTTISEAAIEANHGQAQEDATGILIGVW
jgi:arylsulfatase A-like enzyme